MEILFIGVEPSRKVDIFSIERMVRNSCRDDCRKKYIV